MTKETKIGLLVGLTFIILFAIILSEKGTTSTVRPPVSLSQADGKLADARRTSPSAAPLSGPDTGRFPVEVGLNPPPAQPQQPVNSQSNAVVMLEEPVVGQPIPADSSQIGPIPDEVRNRLNLGAIETEVPIERPATTATDTTMSPYEAVANAIGRNPPTAADEEEVPLDFGESGQDSDAAAPETAANRGAEQPPAIPPGKSIRLKAVHTVEPGESLGKIAARHYGRSNPKRIEAIFNANRDSLKTVHSVKANTKLNIPELDANGDIEFEPAEGFAVAQINTGRAPRVDDGHRIPIPADDDRMNAARTHAGGPRGLLPDLARAVTAPPSQPAAIDDRPNSLRSPARRETAPPRSQAFTWYQVRDRDTLSRIARRELGSERMVGRIYDLNRDILTDKHMLKIGMKIRIPANQAPASADQTLTSMATDALAIP